MKRLGEHVGGETGECSDNKLGEGGQEVVCGPDGGVGVWRVEPWKVQLFLEGTGLGVEDSVLEGLGGGSAPWTDGGEVPIDPGGVGG